MSILKRVAARLPKRYETELKRFYFARQIKKNRFITDEPEFTKLDSLIKGGDWVIDIGANIGHYTKKFSDLVGPKGRVIAFEPVPTTFSLLAANVELFKSPNVTLINAAVSEKLDMVGLSIPKFSTGLSNYYQAHLSNSETSALSVLTIAIDSMNINQYVSLVKIDAEGHEEHVLKGMMKLIKNNHPTLIIETGSQEIINMLCNLGYTSEHLKNSPNILFTFENNKN